jgi:hypothetical protein
MFLPIQQTVAAQLAELDALLAPLGTRGRV